MTNQLSGRAWQTGPWRKKFRVTVPLPKDVLTKCNSYWDYCIGITGIVILYRHSKDFTCLSRIPDPNFSIPDPISMVKKIPGPDLQERIYVYLTQKNCLSSKKYCVIRDVDPGFGFFHSRSRIWIFSIPDTGSFDQKCTGSMIRIRNTA